MASWSLFSGKIIEITMTADLAIFPVIGGTIEDLAKEMVSIASCLGRPVVSNFNAIGIVANIGDTPEEIIRFWEKAFEQKQSRHRRWFS